MRLAAIILVGTVAYMSNTSVSTEAAAIDFPATVQLFGAYTYVFPAKRMLGTYDDHDEERVGGTEKFKAGVSKLIESAKLKSYLAQNKDAVEVLAKLKLGNDALGALRNSKKNALTKYVDMFNMKNPDKALSLISTLTARYGDDGLAKALVIAEKEATTPATVKEIQTLRNDQLTTWLNADKSVDDVFQLLKLHIDGNAAFTKVEVLEEYITKMNSAKSKHITLLDTLRSALGEDNKLVSMIAMAKVGKVNTKEKALELETALIAKWTHENIIPERIFRRLKLNKNGNVGNVLSSDKLETFMKYVDEFNKRNPNRETSLVQSLTTNYGVVAVTEGLASAQKYSSTKTLATKLQTQLFEGWMKSGTSVKDLAKLLKIKDDDIALFVSPKLTALKSYLRLFNHKNDADETLVNALVAGFYGEDKLASMLLTAKRNTRFKEKATKLQNAQFNQWLYDDIDPSNVLTKIFKLEREEWHSASDTQKSIAHQFNTYERNSRVFVEPRRQ